MTYVPALFAPVLAAALALFLDLPKTFGAHPWWSDTVILIGLPIGVLITALLSRLAMPKAAKVSLMGIGTLATLGIAQAGKARFAASYAEDTFGGQMWYVGWIATCALLAALIATTLWPRSRPH